MAYNEVMAPIPLTSLAGNPLSIDARRIHWYEWLKSPREKSGGYTKIVTDNANLLVRECPSEIDDLIRRVDRGF